MGLTLPAPTFDFQLGADRTESSRARSDLNGINRFRREVYLLNMTTTTADEELRLIMRMFAGDVRARNILVSGVQPMNQILFL
tara:strand:+ start:407 stop:655 length:249 start_codon:yes stop_codon:yes gene_type:complete